MLRKILKTILKIIGAVLGFVVLYVILALVIPYIEVGKKPTNEVANIPIYILTNGDHTDLVLPVKSEQIDWSQKILYRDTKSKQGNFKYLGIGWGDKGFYLDTPTWSQLKFSTAFYAAFWLGESAMHCTYYNEMKEGKDCKKIILTKNQYADLIKFIETKFDKDKAGNDILIATNAVYGENDSFYEANGSYSFLYTCNTWANEGLKAAGQKAALWTPSDFGIFQHYK